ncbi:MAG: amidohydrolase family protein [Pseudolabrys sp.]|nr:amidohydrolase family protein [Pseudolabrys sp.]
MNELNRRTILAGTTALSAMALLPRAHAQTSAPAGLPARGEFVIRGAHVLSMDAGIGDLTSGDVHVRNGEIVAVAASVNAPNAQVIDGKGMICMPGFVETHWHHWTNVLRVFMRWDDPQKTYFPITFKYGPHYTPDTGYRSVRLGVCEALAAGITTTGNWCHNVRSPAYADAEIQAMLDMGIRGRFAYGNPVGLPNDKPIDLADIARAKKQWHGKDGMMMLAMNSRGVDNAFATSRGAIGPDMAKHEWAEIRKLELPITMHTSGIGGIKVLNDNGLLGPDVQLIHPLNTTPEEREALAKNKVYYSCSPIGEARRPAPIQFGEMLDAGVLMSLSIDHITTNDADMFKNMNVLATVSTQQLLRMKSKFTSKQMVEMATLGGAKDLKVDDKVGSLKPGKRADLILIRTTDVNIAPIGDPYDALVTFAQPGNVDTVVVDGRILRRGGKFVGIDQPKIMAEAMDEIEKLKSRAGS